MPPGSPGAAPTPLLSLLLAATYPTSPPWIPYGIIGLGGPSGSHVGPTRVPRGGYAVDLLNIPGQHPDAYSNRIWHHYVTREPGAFDQHDVFAKNRYLLRIFPPSSGGSDEL